MGLAETIANKVHGVRSALVTPRPGVEKGVTSSNQVYVPDLSAALDLVAAEHDLNTTGKTDTQAGPLVDPSNPTRVLGREDLPTIGARIDAYSEIARL